MAKRKSGMSTTAYNEAIGKLDLSQIAAGKVLGLSPRQSQRVASGDSPVPAPVAKLLRAILRFKLPLDKVE